MTSYLFNLMIGPVQSFIAQARKTHDLHAGSRLLSQLAQKGFKLLCDEMGEDNVELIFPAFKFDDGEKVKSNPNRFTVVLKETNAQQVQECGVQVKKQLVELYVKEALEKMQFLEPTQRFMAEKQLRSQLEIYWAALPLTDDNYHEVFIQLESQIHGIKNYRPFIQQTEVGRKCNIDGQRNVIVYRRSQKEQGKVAKLHRRDNEPAFVAPANGEKHIKIWELQPGEGLSAVSFAKRTFEQEPHEFFSTAKISLLEDLKRIEADEKFESFYNDMSYAYGQFKHSDDQLLIEENINESVFHKTGNFSIKPDARQAAKKTLDYYHKSKEAFKTAGIHAPLNTKYYGLIIFDGDYMGQWLQGKFLKDPSRLKAFHQTLAKLLRNFGKKARSFLDQGANGQAVYAGGDDFLGFINLNHLFTVLRQLRQLFQEEVNAPLHKKNQAFEVKDKQFSFSGGIALAHYKQPLGMVLNEARKAEQAAKAFPGKNAFVLSHMRHSGGTTLATSSFGADLSTSIDDLQVVCDQLSSKQFSNKFIHNIHREFEGWKKPLKAALYRSELFRLLTRAKANGTEENALIGMQKSLDRILGIQDPENQFLSQSQRDNFTNLLRICDFIHRTTHNDAE